MMTILVFTSLFSNHLHPDFGVFIKNRFNKGRTCYLNLTPIQYWSSKWRLSHSGKNWRDIVSAILNGAGLKLRVMVLEDNRPAVSMLESLFWKNGENIYFGIIENPSDDLEAIKGRPTKITLIFNESISVINLRTGRKFERAKIIKDNFLPWEGNLYKVMSKPGESSIHHIWQRFSPEN